MTTEAQQSAESKTAESNTGPSPEAMAQMEERATKSATEAARKAAEEAANEKLKKVFKELSGEEEKPSVPQRTVDLLKDPDTTLSEVEERAVEKAVERIEKRKAESEALAKKAQEIAKPFFDEVPAISKHLDYVDAIAVRKMQMEKKDFETATKEAFQEAVEKLGLPKVTEEERRAAARRAAIPGMSGVGNPPAEKEFDNEKSTKDFISGLRAKSQSFKERKK